MMADAPRAVPCPLLIADASASQNALPVPVILSNVSVTSPGQATTALNVLVLLPAASVTLMLLPSVPVYNAVNVMHVATATSVAATSVPSVTRTQRMTLAPCKIAVATWVPISNLRF